MSNFERTFGDVASTEAFINRLHEVLEQPKKTREFVTNKDLYRDLLSLTKNFDLKTRVRDLLAAVGEWESGRTFYSLNQPEDREVVLTNLGLLFPKHFSLLALSTYDALSSFSFPNACRLLLNSESATMLLENLMSSSELCVKLSPGLRMALAFGATFYSHPDEKRILTSLAANIPEQRSEQDAIVVDALKERLKNMYGPKRPSRERHGGRTALIVSGQLRGPMSNLRETRARFSLPDVDVYVSTWKRPGRIRIDRSRAARVFTPEAAQRIGKLSDSEIAAVDTVVESSRVSEPDDMRKKIAHELGISDLDRINIQDEDISIFNRMTNHEKMYFHNNYWPSTLGKGWFSSNYDYVIKIRPDLRLELDEPLTLEDLRNCRGIATESNGWKFEGFGLGLGDQLMYGQSDVMERLMSVWHTDSRSAVIRTSGLGRPWALLGHSNLGIELWLSGVDPAKMKFKHRGYIGDPLFDVEELEVLLKRIE